MNQSLNKVILIGNIGYKSNIYHMSNNIDVINISIATSEVWKNKSNGNYDSKTTWHKVAVFGKLAKFVESINIGSKVYIEGTLKYKTWVDKDGSSKNQCEIIVSFGGKILLLSNKLSKNNNNTSDDNIDNDNIDFSGDNIDFDLNDEIDFNV